MIKVALLIDSAGSYGRGLLRGIARFAHVNSDYAVHYEELIDYSELLPQLAAGEFSGVLCRIRNRRQFASLRRLNMPIVDLGNLPPPRGVANIRCDHHAIAELAVDHFMQCGLRTFGYCGFEDRRFSEERAIAFEKYLSRHGFAVLKFMGSSSCPGEAGGSSRRAHFEGSRLRKWLKKIPKPIGIMACNDRCGRFVLDACRQAGVSVPDEVAVLGVDNDEVLCDLAIPSMTSVDPDAERIGFEAAETLDGMIKRRRVPRHPILVPPREVIARQSTNTIAVKDPVAAQALYHIREQGSMGVSIEQVLEHLAEQSMFISRATLERRFESGLGCTLHEEIIRLRLNHIEKLLKNTPYPLSRIAKLCGFNSEPHLSTFYRRHRGTTPGRFRAGGAPQPQRKNLPQR